MLRCRESNGSWFIGFPVLFACLVISVASSKSLSTSDENDASVAQFSRIEKRRFPYRPTRSVGSDEQFLKRGGVVFSKMNYIPAFERYYKRNGMEKRGVHEAAPASLKRSDGHSQNDGHNHVIHSVGDGHNHKRSGMKDIVGNLRSIGRSKRLTPQQLLIMAMMDEDEKDEAN